MRPVSCNILKTSRDGLGCHSNPCISHDNKSGELLCVIQNSVHQALEGCRGVNQPERHDFKLVLPELYYE